MALLKFKRLSDKAIIPQYMTPAAAGCDLHITEDCSIAPGEVVKLPTGWAVEIPYGYEGSLRLRSSTGVKYPLLMPNAPGTIDADYRGEVCILVRNIGGEGTVNLKAGERIAQLILSPVAVEVKIEEVEKLSPTVRDIGGFGSTNG